MFHYNIETLEGFSQAHFSIAFELLEVMLLGNGGEHL